MSLVQQNMSAKPFVLAPLPGPEIYENVENLGFEADPQSWVSSQSTIFEELCEKHKKVKLDTIIEVGSHKGVSARKWALGIDPEGKSGKVYCVDTWLQAGEPYMNANCDWKMVLKHGYPMTYFTFLMNVKAAGMEKQIVPIPLPSSEGAIVLKRHEIKAQIIYIDASHTFRAAYEDISDYWPLLESGGSMLVDDLSLYPDTYAACLRFVAENNLWINFNPIKDGMFGLFSKP